MSTFIELHLITYFTMLMFLMLAVKLLLKTKAHLWEIVLASAMFAIIKFLLDYYLVYVLWQGIALFVYVLLTSLIVHKLSHISKLVIASFVFIFYYLCLVGLNWVITTLILKQNIKTTNNFYLFIILGLNFIVFSIFCAVIAYLQAENAFKLTQKCFLTIGNLKIQLVGFLDTGNCLKDPKTNKSVIVVGINSIRKFLTDKMYADLIFVTNASGVFNGISRVQYSTISQNGFLTIFEPNSFVVNGKKIECCVGVSFKKMEYDALLTSACI